MTLNCVMAVILRYFTEFNRQIWGPITSKWLTLNLYCLQKCSPEKLVLAIYDLWRYLSEISRNEFVRERHPWSKVIIWHCDKRCEMRCKLIYSLIGSRIRTFDWYQNRWSWMTLNGIVPADLHYLCGIRTSWDFHCRSSTRHWNLVCSRNHSQ